MPRIAKFRTYFCKKNSGGGPLDDPRPDFQYTFFFLSFLWPLKFPTFRRQAVKLRHWYTNIFNTDLNDTPYYYIIWIYKRTVWKSASDTWYKENWTGQFRLREYLFTHTCQTAGLPRGGLPLSLLSRGSFGKLPICFIFSSYRSILTIKKLIKPLFIFNQQ